MESVVVVFVIVVVLCTWAGVKLVRRGLRPSQQPTIPPARLANLEGRDAAYEKAARVMTRAPRKIGKGLAVGLGLGLIAAPWLAVYSVYQALSDLRGGGSKGRVLRIRNRARLPELATGDEWSTDEEVTLDVVVPAREREAIGELWLLAARMEHASVAAFSQLALHLTALGAPARLLAATHRAALEEIEHARRCYAIARALTGVAHSAGPIEALGAGARAPIDLTRLAIGSLVDGCLAEGIAADVARTSAARAHEPTIQATLAMIAREEAGHAELAWDVLAWCLERGDASVRSAVAARIELLDREVTPRLPEIAGTDAGVLAAHGVLDQDSIGRLAVARIRAVQDRARQLIDEQDVTRLAA